MWEHFQEGVKPHADIAPPAPARDLSQKWFDPQWRAEYLDWYVAHSSLMADMLPVANTQLGPGSLAAILGGVFEGGEDTIWIHPDPNFNDEIVFNPEHPNWLLHKELLKACKAKANGNYFVGMPDLMEGLDVLAALKGTDMVLLDTVMQPEVLEQQMQQINDIYFKVFDELYDIIREGDEMAFCYFSSWAPGKMSKLQSDISTMISQDDYRRFVQPFIREQCQKIDYTLYHLDGVGAMHHLPALLEIEELNAIQWTPGVGEPQGGSPKWYDLYKKILAGGKSVMACWVTLEELKPLLDHIGADGVHLEMDFHNEREVEQRQLKATYQAQKRGGRGISGMTRKEEDIVQEMFVGSTHDYVLFVTDKGRLFRIKGYTIAEGSRTSKGSNIVNLLQLAEGEKVTNMICQSKDADNEGGFVTMVTKQGLIKRTPLEQYANIRKSGLIGIALNEGDALAWTRLTSGHDMLIVATRNGQAIRFNEEDARPMGRSGHGVRAIKLAEGDEVVGVCICRENATILTVTENGKGRRSDIDTYRITARGGKGIRNYDASKDKVAAVKIVDDVDDVLLSSQEGIIIRLHANEIPVQSRYGSGVRVMRLGENDKVMVLARTDHDDEAQTETVEVEEGDEPTAEQLAAMEAADEASASEAPAED